MTEPIIITEEQIERIVELGRIIWSNLSNDERENYYYDNGTIGFVEDVLRILCLHENNDYNFESVEVFDRVHDRIIYEE